MRALAFVIASLFAVAPLAAQQACSAAAQQDATAVASLRTELRSTQLNEDAPEDDISPRAQQNLSAFKATLAKTVRDILACNSTTVTAPMLQDELAKLLTANPPQPPSGATIDLPFADFARIDDDKIVEYRTYYDQAALLTQLGL